MKVELVYFSAAGNTAYLTAAISQALRKSGHNVNSQAMENLPLDWQMPECDLFGFGGPVHFCAPPDNCMEFIRRLDGRGMLLFSYWSMGLYAGDCGRIFQLAAQKQGFRPIADFEAIFPGIDAVMELPRHSPINYFNVRIEARLLDRVDQFVQGLSTDAPARINPPRWYVPLNNQANKIGTQVYDGFKRKLHSLPERCNQCNWCVRNCPVGAIKQQENSLHFDSERCLLCLRCYHACPTEAIQIGKQTLNHGRYAGPHQARHYVPLDGYAPQIGKPKRMVTS